MFLPGQKIICTDGDFRPDIAALYDELPQSGKAYVVRDIVPGIEPSGGATVTVLLMECRNTPNRHGIEPGFHLMRFRELNAQDAFVAKLAAFHKQRRKSIA